MANLSAAPNGKKVVDWPGPTPDVLRHSRRALYQETVHSRSTTIMSSKQTIQRRFPWLCVLVLGTGLLAAGCATSRQPGLGFREAWSGLGNELRAGEQLDHAGYRSTSPEGREIEDHLLR